MALWGMDVKTLPLRTLSTGGRFFFPKGAHETFDTLAVAWQHKDFLMEWENSAGAVIPPHERDYGVAFYGTQGTLVADRSKWEVFPQGEKVATKVVERQGDAYAIHTANFLECVRTRNRATACTIENGTLCAKYAHLGNIGARLKHSAPLVYDEAQKKFDNPEANTFIAPVYRAPWAFPKP
ncbi:MAG: hypothetical protein LBV28_03920, partial [Puniceicoccales bacterium]|jgi:hypothetical protein|nr:hypothetical protein [Puniceicoccales bacterium]